MRTVFIFGVPKLFKWLEADLGPKKSATAMAKNPISMVASGPENRDSLAWCFHRTGSSQCS
jgi:hypothetical protein